MFEVAKRKANSSFDFGFNEIVEGECQADKDMGLYRNPCPVSKDWNGELRCQECYDSWKQSYDAHVRNGES